MEDMKVEENIQDDTATATTSVLLPPKPEEPLDSDCCGTGCSPCVFDIYKTKLKTWEQECERIRTGGDNSSAVAISSQIDQIVTPYDYAEYIILEITEDCQACKIVRFGKADLEFRSLGTHYRLNGNKFPVKVGQHVLLKLRGRSRQYTVLDVGKDATFTIIFKIYPTGWLTPLVNNLSVGDCVEMRGPFGNEFNYAANSYNSLVMFAAGTGIAPFYRIVSQVLEDEMDETRLLLLFACCNENEILLLQNLKEWSRHWNFQVQYFFSNTIDKKKAQGIHYGMKVNFKKIDKTDIEFIVGSCKGKNNLFLICGTKSFEKDIVNYLKSLGVTDEKIKLF